MKLTIKYLKPTANTEKALASRLVTIDGETDFIDLAEVLCDDSNVLYDDILCAFSEREELPSHGQYRIAVYPYIKAGRKNRGKVKTNITLTKETKQKAKKVAENQGISLSDYIEILINKETA